MSDCARVPIWLGTNDQVFKMETPQLPPGARERHGEGWMWEHSPRIAPKGKRMQNNPFPWSTL